MSTVSLDQVDLSGLTETAKWTYTNIVVPQAEEDLSDQEIADRLGIPRRRVSDYVARLKDEMRMQAEGPVLPPLDQDRYDALKASISELGQRKPGVRNKQTGNLVDGHHRQRVAAELNRDFWEVEIDVPEDMERDIAIALNTAGRQFDESTLGRVIEAELIHNPARSSNAIGRAYGISHHTVEKVRLKLIALGTIEHVKKGERTDKLGRKASPGRPPKDHDAIAAGEDRDAVGDGQEQDVAEVEGIYVDAVLWTLYNDVLPLLRAYYKAHSTEYQDEEIEDLLDQIDEQLDPRGARES